MGLAAPCPPGICRDGRPDNLRRQHAPSFLGQDLAPLIARPVRPELHFGLPQPAIEVAPADDRPPIVEKDFDRAPIRHPGEYEQALFDDFAEGQRLDLARNGWTGEGGKKEDGESRWQATGARCGTAPSAQAS